MATVNELIKRIRSQFRSDKGEVGFLSASLTDVGTNLQTTATCVYVGTVLEIENEQVYVTANPSDDNYTIVRGWNGTTAAAHNNGVLFYVDPTLTRQDILNSIKDEINSWPTTVYNPVSRDFSVEAGQGLVEIPFDTEVVKILKIERVDCYGNTRGAMYSGGPYKSNNNFYVRINVWDAPADYIAVVGLRFDTQFITYTTDLMFVDIPDNFMDIIVYGVAWRNRLGAEEIRVTGSAGPTTHVREGSSVQAAGAYKTIRDERLHEETYRLRELYGV
jgi:hypothetical protein